MRESVPPAAAGGIFSWAACEEDTMEERNIALKLMYNGTAYHGWQVQKNAVTVAETWRRHSPPWCATR